LIELTYLLVKVCKTLKLKENAVQMLLKLYS